MKPTVFLSHASVDEIRLASMKNDLVVRTNSAVNFFLSSDGQSIPLGRNWVHRIEEELKTSRLMFVFLSPSAARSQWIPFEAGYAYSRGIRVVPVGILGVNLSELSPPLSLLQGFNIRGADGLNNILAVLNDEFALTVPESFTHADYAAVFGTAACETASPLGRFVRHVSEVSVYFNCDSSEAIEIARRLIGESHLQVADGEHSVTTSGAMFFKHSHTVAAVDLDPALLQVTMPLVDRWLSSVAQTDPPIEVTVSLYGGLRDVSQPHKLTARLYGTPIELTRDGRLRFGDTHVSITQHENAPHIELKSSIASLTLLRLDELLDIIFEREIVYQPTLSGAP